METKFTAGTWKYNWRQVNGEADCGVFSEPHEGQAYSVCRAPRYQTKEQWDADARLIAASPLLLTALKEIVALDDGDSPDLWHFDVEFAAARAAIAAATGSQS